MADISVRGFVNKPVAQTNAHGAFSKFTLTEGVKQKDGSYQNFAYNVTNWKEPQPPEEGAQVEIKGWLKLRYFGEDGVKRVSLDVTAQEMKVLSGPKPKAAAGTPAKDPWES